MGSVTKGLTENISLFLMESLKGLPDTLGDIDAHPVSYHRVPQKPLGSKLYELRSHPLSVKHLGSFQF